MCVCVCVCLFLCLCHCWLHTDGWCLEVWVSLSHITHVCRPTWLQRSSHREKDRGGGEKGMGLKLQTGSKLGVVVREDGRLRGEGERNRGAERRWNRFRKKGEEKLKWLAEPKALRTIWDFPKREVGGEVQHMLHSLASGASNPNEPVYWTVKACCFNAVNFPWTQWYSPPPFVFQANQTWSHFQPEASQQK